MRVLGDREQPEQVLGGPAEVTCLLAPPGQEASGRPQRIAASGRAGLLGAAGFEGGEGARKRFKRPKGARAAAGGGLSSLMSLMSQVRCCSRARMSRYLPMTATIDGEPDLDRAASGFLDLNSGSPLRHEQRQRGADPVPDWWRPK